MNFYTYYSFLFIGTILGCFLSANFAVQKNWWGVFISGLIFNIVWSTCSKYTERLMFDALLYDLSLTIFYYLFLFYLLDLNQLKWYNWTGVCLSIVGLILFKIKG